MISLRFFCAGLVVVGSAGLLAAAPVPKKAVDAQLKTVFQGVDQNSDGFLSGDELARHFRGPKAAPPPAMYDDKGNISQSYEQAKSKYPDMLYLVAMDHDNDGRISWNEFRSYGENFARALQKRQAKLQSLQKAYVRAMQNRMRAIQRQRQAYMHAVQNRIRAMQRRVSYARRGRSYSRSRHRSRAHYHRRRPAPRRRVRRRR